MSDERPGPRGGFRYVVTDEQIRAFRKLTAEQKLRQLEALEEFLAAAMTPRAKRIRARFRRGHI
jgi:hypothetical protein